MMRWIAIVLSGLFLWRGAAGLLSGKPVAAAMLPKRLMGFFGVLAGLAIAGAIFGRDGGSDDIPPKIDRN